MTDTYRIVEKHPITPENERWWVIAPGADPDTSPRFGSEVDARTSIAEVPDEQIQILRW